MFWSTSDWLFGFKWYSIEPCGFIDTTYVTQIKRVSKKVLNMINSKVVRRKTHTRARESHRQLIEEEEEL